MKIIEVYKLNDGSIHHNQEEAETYLKDNVTAFLSGYVSKWDARSRQAVLDRVFDNPNDLIEAAEYLKELKEFKDEQLFLASEV